MNKPTKQQKRLGVSLIEVQTRTNLETLGILRDIDVGVSNGKMSDLEIVAKGKDLIRSMQKAIKEHELVCHSGKLVAPTVSSKKKLWKHRVVNWLENRKYKTQ